LIRGKTIRAGISDLTAEQAEHQAEQRGVEQLLKKAE